ncbi:hypothetical protein HLRTI_002924 [Halorhabdus tiamatea SARL4B]|uniref:Uncharacterized protein n=1 Tax=Halorhabdus tiamatea SARL4B TaxID=1033806 RepID=U2F466_9EURY|nr:hypothetical protein [Halorhabdus tiamatea]ERJ05125.1 hypothetical protein HLRTI_002924 [Halorhabdus tiamatea SARL4B]
MGHTHHTYDEFDSNLVRPLYGYVTEFENGTVPTWAKEVSIYQSEAEELLGLDHVDGNIPGSELPSGMKRDRGGQRLTRYTVKPKTYLDLHRERVQEADETHRFNRVQFDLRMRQKKYSRKETVPSKVKDRLSEVKNTTHWKRTVDGYHTNFRCWTLTYDLGPRGGIQDVHIKADMNH